MINRKKLILFPLLGVLAILMGRAVFRDSQPEPQATAPAAARPAPRPVAQGTPAPPGDNEGVRLDLLNREREPYQGTRHDLFAPLFTVTTKPAKPSMPAVPPPPPLPRIPALPPLPAPPPLPGTPSPAMAAQQELARFTYLGFLEKRGAKSIFLSSGDEIFVVKQGDRFGRGRQFQVAQLTPDRLVVRQESDPRPITIPLVEQAPLTPSGGRFGGGRVGASPSFPGGMQGGEAPPAPEGDFVPEEPPVEEPPPAEETQNPFVSPGQMGSPGVLQPLRPPPAPAPSAAPQFGPAFNQSTR